MSDQAQTRFVAASQVARQLAPVFSSAVMLDLARRGHSPRAVAIARESVGLARLEGMTYTAFFEYCHERLWEGHRCEYVYKNAIASKVLLGRHSVRSTSFLSEFRVEECKADVVLINGTSTCYEIKTELDGLDRLNRQMQSYTKVFDRTHVVTFEGCAERIERAVPAKVGILTLTDSYTIRTHREAGSNRTQVLPGSIFDSLRRDEYMAILHDALGEVPDVPNTRMYQECRRLFCNLPPEIAHDGMVRALKRRNLAPQVAGLVESAAPSLRAAILVAPLRTKDVPRLTDALGRVLIQ